MGAIEFKKKHKSCIVVLIDGEEYGLLHTPLDRVEHLSFTSVNVYKNTWELLIKHPAAKISNERRAAIEQKLNELNKGVNDGRD